jgi:large subunit ribosomal protein L25
MRENSLNVELRTEKGKGANSRLRQSGYIPAVLYSHGKSEMIKIKKQDFFSIFRGNVSESIMIDLNITDKKKDNAHKVFIKAYQQDPVTEELLHVDLYKTTLGERIHTKVPVEIIGKSEGEKMGGILEVVERELEIECLPNEMPEKIEIDVTNINIGESIHIEDIETAGSVKFMIDEKRAIVTVLAPKAYIEEEEEIEELEAEAVEGEEEVQEEQEREEGEKTEE